MIKRLFYCFLSVVLMLCIVPFAVWAEQPATIYSQSAMNTISLKYDDLEKMVEPLFCKDSEIAYWKMIHQIKQNSTLTWALDYSSQLVDELPTKETYSEILANLIVMQSGSLAEQVGIQSRFDNLKSAGDYAWDVVEIMASFLGASKAAETISLAVSTGVDGIGDVVIKNLEHAKYYEATIQDYSQSYEFLNAIYQNADNSELRDAARSLLQANDSLLSKRLDYLIDVGKDFAEYESTFFINNMGLELLKEVDLYAADKTVRTFVDKGIEIKDSILSLLDLYDRTLKIGLLAGDIGFGTTDVYNRYQEMKTIASISDALVKASHAIVIPQQANSAKMERIQEKCSLYKSLVACHARGEYLIWQLLMNDAGMLSDIRWIAEYSENGKIATDEWYDSQIEILTRYGNKIDQLFILDDASAQSPKEHAGFTPRLTQISSTHGKYATLVEIAYNAENQICEYKTQTHSASGIIEYDYQYTYHSSGQLISVKNVIEDYVTLEYQLGDNGRIISKTVHDYPSHVSRTQYEYNHEGQLVRNVSEDGDTVTNMVYRPTGELASAYGEITYGDMFCTFTRTYSYGDDGKLEKMVSNEDWGFEQPRLYEYRYTYDYSGLEIVECFTNGLLNYTELRLDNPYVNMLSLDLDESATFNVENGLLRSVTGDDYAYTFFYDGEIDTAFDEKNPTVQYSDELTGDYTAYDADIRIKITAENSSDYLLTYTTPEITLKDIPVAYFTSASATSKCLVFIVSTVYPNYPGKITITWDKNALFLYEVNADIEGVTGTNGAYYALEKLGVYIPLE